MGEVDGMGKKQNVLTVYKSRISGTEQSNYAFLLQGIYIYIYVNVSERSVTQPKNMASRAGRKERKRVCVSEKRIKKQNQSITFEDLVSSP